MMIQILQAAGFSHSSLLLETQAVECPVEFDAFERYEAIVVLLCSLSLVLL